MLFKKGLQALGGFSGGFWGFRKGFTKKGFATAQRVYKSDGKVKEGFASRYVLVRSGCLDGLEGLHCLNGTYGLEGLHTFV